MVADKVVFIHPTALLTRIGNGACYMLPDRHAQTAPFRRLTDHIQCQSQKTARHFRRLYLVALSLIAALAIGGQLLVQQSLTNQLGDGHVVNKAGYQRMLSQRITLKLMLHDAGAGDTPAQIAVVAAMRDRWLEAHHELANNVARIAYDEMAWQKLLALLTEAGQPLTRISELIGEFASSGKLTPAQRATLMADQEMFLPLMDAFVLGLEHSVHARVTFLQRVEITLLCITLLVLALEAVFIFRPAVVRLQSSLDQLERRNRQAARRLESLQHLAGGIAHRFNNILTGIMGNAGLERVDALQHRRNTEYIDAQIQGCRQAAQIITQLVTYSGQGQYHFEPVALGPWLVEMEKTWGHMERAIRLRIAWSEDVMADIDQVALKQALDGLVTNGIEATNEGNREITVQLTQILLTEPKLTSGPYRTELPSGLYALIRIIDQGKGVATEELDRIFDPFYTNKEFGRGLGLAAILGIVHGHGGGIVMESKLGLGSTVSVFLPQSARETQSSIPSNLKLLSSLAVKGYSRRRFA